MTDAKTYPVFDERDRSVFSIEDSRLRADTLRDTIVPRLREIARVAFAAIEEVYGIDPLSDSAESLSPEHRRDAAKTKAFRAAWAGLVKRQVAGKYHYLHLRFELDESGLYPLIEAHRPLESETLLGVLRDNRESGLQILDDLGIGIWTEDIQDSDISDEDVIEKAKVDHSKQWWHTHIRGSATEYPIDSDEIVDHIVNQFIGMFAIYQATCERLAGSEDHFPDYFQSYLDAVAGEDDGEDDDEDDDENGEPVDSLNPELSGVEGEIVHAMTMHRRREQRLRQEKIKAVLEATGRLQCEVPGCGFDFLEVYGEIGEGFAHVHHRKPLGDRSEPSETKLVDLAIVCANCHAMIHRDGTTRALEGLIKTR